MNCYNCDTILEDNWNYCPNCKRKIRKNNKIHEELVSSNEIGKCHKCSCLLNDTWNFCPVCGTSAEFYSEKPSVIIPTIATNTENKSMIIPVVAKDNEAKAEETRLVENNIKNEKHCPNCGTIVTEEHLFCASCGGVIKQNEVNVKNKAEEDEDNSYLIWVVVTLIATPLGFVLGELITDELVFPAYLVSLFSIIYAKVKYPKNMLVKVVFWIFIILSILAIIVFAVLMAAFIIACGNCLESIK